MYLTLLLDAEDLVDPRSDDVALRVAQILAEEGTPATFGVVGEKARLWERRGRQDIIRTLEPFDISLHTNFHSVHPTVAEYLEGMGWEDGVAEVVAREGPGVRDVQRIFGRMPSCWGRGGSSWGPQVAPALRQMGVPAEMLSLTHLKSPLHSMHRFCGTLSYYPCYYGGFYAAFSDDAAFAVAWAKASQYISDRAKEGVDWLGLYVCSPEMMRAKTWWDGPNFDRGVNAPPGQWRLPDYRSDAEWEVAQRNLRRLVTDAARLPGVQLRTVGEVNALAIDSPSLIQVSDLSARARTAAASQEIEAADSLLSPAETIYLWGLWLSAGRPGGALPYRYVEGPVEESCPSGAAETVSAEQIQQAACALCQAVERSGRLPASLDLGQGELAIGTVYHAFADACAGDPGGAVRLRPGAQVPGIGQTLGEEVATEVPGWLHKPDLDVTGIATYTRLQSWTLKPVVLH